MKITLGLIAALLLATLLPTIGHAQTTAIAAPEYVPAGTVLISPKAHDAGVQMALLPPGASFQLRTTTKVQPGLDRRLTAVLTYDVAFLDHVIAHRGDHMTFNLSDDNKLFVGQAIMTFCGSAVAVNGGAVKVAYKRGVPQPIGPNRMITVTTAESQAVCAGEKPTSDYDPVYR